MIRWLIIVVRRGSLDYICGRGVKKHKYRRFAEAVSRADAHRSPVVVCGQSWMKRHKYGRLSGCLFGAVVWVFLRIECVGVSSERLSVGVSWASTPVGVSLERLSVGVSSASTPVGVSSERLSGCVFGVVWGVWVIL